MQDLRFYLLIEDKERESEVRIDGNLETLRDVIHTLRVDLAPFTSLPAEDPKPCKEGTNAITA